MMAEHYKPDWLDASKSRWFDEDNYRKQREERAGALEIAEDMRKEGREDKAREALASTNLTRRWNHKQVAGGIQVGTARKVVLINAGEKRWYKKAFVLCFNACGATYVHIYADGLESTIEECAAWLAEHAPGHIEPLAGETYQELMSEACEEAGLEWPPPDDADMEPYWDAESDALADMTQTKSGYLTSYEWGISLENPDTETLFAFVHGD